MWKIGVSSKMNDVDDAMLAEYAEAGVEVMELCPHYERYDEVDYEGVRRLADKHGVTLWSYHLQFYPVIDISVSSPDVRSFTLERLRGQIRRAADIGIDKFVIHPSKEPISDAERAERMKTSKENLCILADEAERCNAILAVEDLPRTCLGHNSAEMLELISADDRLRVCFDTNHLVGEADHDFVRAVGKRILTLHVSDYDFVDERHWMPGRGKVDWTALVNALCDVGYDGVWMYEIDFTTSEKRKEGEYVCADFVRNAREIFKAARGERG